jgi:hypothetical protein
MVVSGKKVVISLVCGNTLYIMIPHRKMKCKIYKLGTFYAFLYLVSICWHLQLACPIQKQFKKELTNSNKYKKKKLSKIIYK